MHVRLHSNAFKIFKIFALNIELKRKLVGSIYKMVYIVKCSLEWYILVFIQPVHQTTLTRTLLNVLTWPEFASKAVQTFGSLEVWKFGSKIYRK